MRRPRPRKAQFRAMGEVMRNRLPQLQGFTPYPCELTLICYDPDLMESYRFLNCPGYGSCLSVARVAGWRNFSCRACPIYTRYHDKWAKRVRRPDSE